MAWVLRANAFEKGLATGIILFVYTNFFSFFSTHSQYFRRRKNKKQERIPSHLDFSPPSVRPHRSLPTTPYAKAKESRDSTTSQNSHQSKSPIGQFCVMLVLFYVQFVFTRSFMFFPGSLRGDMPLSPTNQSDPWSRNNISLKTEMSHKKGHLYNHKQHTVHVHVKVQLVNSLYSKYCK